jgi:hypothetical protein
MRVARIFVPILLLPVFVACTGASTTTTTSPAPDASGPAPTGVDPLVPYSPAPTPFVERTTGFIPDTLTLPTSDGGKLYLTPLTTTMTTIYVHEARAFVVYLDVENPGEVSWTGTVGADAQVTDLTGAVFVAGPASHGDLHPDPQRYGGSNRNLLKPIAARPGATVQGALVFHVTGGNRPITLRISVDGGTTWGEWATNLGVF